MTEQHADLAAVAHTVEQARISIDRIRKASDWLAALVEPGRLAAWSTRAVTDDQAERLEALGYSDRAFRQHNLRHGMSALPPAPTPLRLGIVDARHQVHLLVSAAAERLDLCLVVGDLDGKLDAIDQALDGVRDPRVAAAVDRALQRADRACRSASQSLDEEVETIGRRCPACGRRSLQREVSTAGGPRVVRCVSASCRCTGDGGPDQAPCGCLQPSKREGLDHVWLPSELDGPTGLWAAIAAATPAPGRLNRSAAGHGGWQSRNMGGAK